MTQNDKNAGAQGHDLSEQGRQAAENVAGRAQDATSAAAERVKDMASQAAQAAREQAQAGTAAVGSGMRNLASSLREHAPHEGMLGNAASGLADSLQRGGEYLEHEGLSGILEDVGALIRRNPIPAVLVGVGVGFLLAQLMRGSER